MKNLLKQTIWKYGLILIVIFSAFQIATATEVKITAVDAGEVTILAEPFPSVVILLLSGPILKASLIKERLIFSTATKHLAGDR